jgi:plastocyanin
VEDVSPVVTVPVDMIINLAQGETDSIAEFSVNATDNVAVTVGPTCTPASGSTFAIGNNTITCTAADAAGNVGTSTFVISIVEYDTTPPTVTVPSDITINEIASNVGGVATFSVTATDNVAVTVGPTCTPISGATFTVGDNTVTCTAEDVNGNIGTATFVITVVEYVPPPISATVTNAPGSSTPGCEPDCFIPSTVTISVDGTVTWQNSDNASHTATSGTASSGASGHWDSSLVMAGGSFSHTFDQDGTYHYFCMVHPWMQGSVVVGDGTPIRTAEPEPEPTPVEEVDEEVDEEPEPAPVPATESVTVTNAPGSSTPGCEETYSCFIPYTATIFTGGTVTWVNIDNAAHTATSGSATDGPSGVWDSGLMMVGGSYAKSFYSAGTYPYFCMVHPWMHGFVIVEGESQLEAETTEVVETESEIVTPSDGISVGSEITIETDIINQQSSSQIFAYIVQIKDESGTALSISTITGSLGQGQTLTQAISWTPSESGVYVAEIFLWNDLNAANPLSNVQFQYFTVTG